MTDSFKQDLTKTPERKKATKKIVSSLFFAMLFLLLPSIINIVATGYLTYFVDVDDVFLYYEVGPVESPSDRMKPLAMQSENVWYEAGGNVTWNDVLRCEVGGVISEQTSIDINFQPPRPLGERGSAQWQYNGRLPETANVCNIRSTIRWCYSHLSAPVCKQQTVTSEPILFVQ